MFTELRDYRDLLLLMTHRNFVLRYRQTMLGMAWAVFMPVINTIVFTLIFRRVAKIETDVPYPVFSYCGLLPWNLFATSLKNSVNTLVANKNLLNKVYFPREVFPFATVLVSVVDFVVGLSILGLMMLYYRIPLSATALFLPILIIVQLMFTAGLAMLLAPANLYYRDVKYILDVVVAVGMFATPVVYPTRHVTGTLGVVLQMNPLAPIIDGYRAILLRGELPSVIPFTAVAVVSFGLFAVGWIVFHRAEYAFAENA
jgi:ABC-2 type transport system permease protein/lipopolysaccharide transport system permease protein